VQALAWNIDIDPEPEMKPLVVFNPHAWASRINVELESTRIPPDMDLLDDEDRQIPMQTVQSQVTTGGRLRLSFIAELPSLGYRTYRLAKRPMTITWLPMIEATDRILEGDCFRLEFDPSTGYIKSLRDKKHEVEVFRGEAAVPVVLDDSSDTWSHDV